MIARDIEMLFAPSSILSIMNLVCYSFKLCGLGVIIVHKKGVFFLSTTQASSYKGDLDREQQTKAIIEKHDREIAELQAEVVVYQQRLEVVQLMAQTKENAARKIGQDLDKALEEAARVEQELARARKFEIEKEEVQKCLARAHEEVRAKTSQVKQYKKQVDQLKAQVSAVGLGPGIGTRNNYLYSSVCWRSTCRSKKCHFASILSILRASACSSHGRHPQKFGMAIRTTNERLWRLPVTGQYLHPGYAPRWVFLIMHYVIHIFVLCNIYAGHRLGQDERIRQIIYCGNTKFANIFGAG